MNKRTDELLTGAQIFVARMDEERVEHSDGRIKGLPRNIDPTKPPKNFRVAMRRKDWQEWAEAYDVEHQGFYEHQTLTISRPEPDAKILGIAIPQAQGAIVYDGQSAEGRSALSSSTPLT